jgi:hypothetical protein
MKKKYLIKTDKIDGNGDCISAETLTDATKEPLNNCTWVICQLPTNKFVSLLQELLESNNPNNRVID